ncbi:ABC transporter substrate-binding protein [Streptomyces sp. NPDC058195]|uniref:peptide ABC transporter substrate-binding protein n=1 Tax=Streptomyces sp. NPDC058195 TaxID=3346375 RepID=UPI0036E64DF0
MNLIRVNGAEPQNGLVPADTLEGIGARIVSQLFTGLYEYGADGEIHPAMLDRLDSADDRHYTVRLQPGWTFTDATAVTAHSYVDAWNYAALSTNHQGQRSFFAPVQGYEDVAADPPRATTLSGLTVLDDLTFTITLRAPDRDFPRSLGCLPARPLPRAFFERGSHAFGQSPIGNGRYMLAGPDAWHHGQHLTAVANPDYRGPFRPRNDGLVFVFYDSLVTAHDDLRSGHLDVLDSIPDSLLSTRPGHRGRQTVTTPVALNCHLAIPCALPGFTGEEGRLRRAALSQAIDRPHLTSHVLHGARSPARDFVGPAVPGGGVELAGSGVLRFDPAAARALWAEAERHAPLRETFTVAYHSSGGYDRWVTALCRQVRDVLGIDVGTEVHPTFKSIRDRIARGDMRSAFRTGWRGDYPSQINFLDPLFTAGAPGNEVGYASERFETALGRAKAARNPGEFTSWARRAQEILLEDLPVIPLWDHRHTGGLGEGVSAAFTWNGMPDYPHITKRAPRPSTIMQNA